MDEGSNVVVSHVYCYYKWFYNVMEVLAFIKKLTYYPQNGATGPVQKILIPQYLICILNNAYYTCVCRVINIPRIICI